METQQVNSQEDLAKLLIQAVGKLTPYEQRKFKLQNSPSFKLAINPARELHIWIRDEWMPKQPDKKALALLLKLLNFNMIEFANFVYHGDRYWQILEKKHSGEIPLL